MADNQLFNDNDGVGGGEDIFVYTGGDQQVPRYHVERVRIAENVDTIPAGTFYECTQLIEVVGHDKLKKIERSAFHTCVDLRWLRKMTGLIEIEAYAFFGCHEALRELEFDKLEIIGEGAFGCCQSLRSINLPSINRVGKEAFMNCHALTDAVLGEKLERIEEHGFLHCESLRHITIPLKDNFIIGYNAFGSSQNLSRVDALAEEIHKTISSLHMESWRDEMEGEIDRINQTLPNIRAFQKTQAIQQWIERVLQRMEHYKSEHKALVKEAMTLLELALWKANLLENEADDAAAAQEGERVTRGQRKRKRKDRCITSGASIVIKNVLPFLALK